MDWVSAVRDRSLRRSGFEPPRLMGRSSAQVLIHARVCASRSTYVSNFEENDIVLSPSSETLLLEVS